MEKRKFRQSFTNTERPFVYDPEVGCPIEGDIIDLQEKINSAYDDTFISRLEAVLGAFDVPSNFYASGDIEEYSDFPSGSKLDRLENTMETLHRLRNDYGIGDTVSISDAIAILKSKEVYVKEVSNNEENSKNEDGEAQSGQKIV